MDTFFNKPELLKLAKNFYLVTGLRVTIWNTSTKKSIAYPEKCCAFCELLKKKPFLEQQCWKCDSNAMKRVQQGETLTISSCHAGLVDCLLKITESDQIIGYLMIGQVSNNPDKEERTAQLLKFARSYNIPDEKSIPAIEAVQYYSYERLTAATAIAETCISHIILKKLILSEKNQIINRTAEFIQSHMEDNISVNDICRSLNISRSSLYNTFAADNKSVGKFITEAKLDHARSLLINTKLSIGEVAKMVGFNDYNYFSRIYKKRYGLSPHSYRKS